MDEDLNHQMRGNSGTPWSALLVTHHLSPTDSNQTRRRNTNICGHRVARGKLCNCLGKSVEDVLAVKRSLLSPLSGAIGDISVQNKHILSIDTLPHMWLQISCFDTEQKICCGNHRGLRHRHFVLLSVALPQVNDSYWSTLPVRPSGGSFSFPSKVNCFTLGALYPGMFSMSLMLSIHLFSSFSGGKKRGGGGLLLVL